ncbi:MAG: flagellar biosynthetic protein FliR [Rhodobacteraceae bacterium]|nr:flagellar biosynthetic protein FliR [Paracoccaceae bacterium]
MNALLAEMLVLSQVAMLAGFVVFLRVGAAMALLPAFGERSVPVRVRLGLALAFTLIVAPVVAPGMATALDAGNARFLFTETIAGLTIGAVVRFLVMALQIAGSIAAQSTSLSQIFGGATVDPQPAMGHVFLTAGLALAVYTGLHIRLTELFVLSYEVFPPGQLPDAGALTEWGIMRAANAFSLAFALAAPFVIASLIYNVALGVINRAMPQLMVAFVGAPAITAGGLILLMITAPFLLSVWIEALNSFLSVPFGGF